MPGHYCTLREGKRPSDARLSVSLFLVVRGHGLPKHLVLRRAFGVDQIVLDRLLGKLKRRVGDKINGNLGNNTMLHSSMMNMDNKMNSKNIRNIDKRRLNGLCRHNAPCTLKNKLIQNKPDSPANSG